MNEKMIEKIKKLLALAGNNPDKAEAQSAMLKAQELMAQYGVEVDMSEGDKIEYSLEIGLTPMNNGYRISLGHIIADNFRVKLILVDDNICFLGRKTDARIAKETFDFAYAYIRRMSSREEKRAREERGTAKGVSNVYCQGFLRGLKEKMDEQCRALMLVRPKDVDEEYNRRFPTTHEVKRGMRSIGYDDKAYRNGLADGRSFLGSRQIKG